jgi:multimeric flavodoxin WrbA
VIKYNYYIKRKCGVLIMRVLAIIGSPRNGNSYKTTQLVEKKMKELGEVEFEYLFLRDAGIGHCVGCHNCIIRGEGSCPHKENIEKIENQLMGADGVIFVSPIYTFHITALMKNFIDHFSYLVHRPRFFGKQAMVFVQRGGMFKEALNYLIKVVRSWGFDVSCKLGIPDLEPLTENFKNKCLKEIDKSSKKFYRSIKNSKLKSPSLHDIITFKVWKINAAACKDSIPEDFSYWKEKGWFDKDYYYDVKIAWHVRIASMLIEKIIRIFMRNIFAGY